jgi:GNAT superfamily N-acetyltransferase
MICADGKPAGVIDLAPCEDNELPDTGEIMAMYLLKPYWRTGLAQKVIDSALGWMRGQGLSAGGPLGAGGQRAPLKFYRKCGFCTRRSKTSDFTGGAAFGDSLPPRPVKTAVTPMKT